MNGCSALDVARTVVFDGKVEVETAGISGTFQGFLVARQVLILRASGRIRGKIF